MCVNFNLLLFNEYYIKLYCENVVFKWAHGIYIYIDTLYVMK